MSPRSAARNEALREASRARILKHALRLFAAKGYASTSIDAIVKAARMSPGLLYHYFPGKQALLRAIFEESMRDVKTSFAMADAAGAPEKRLGGLLRGATLIVKTRREFWALSYSVRMQPEVLAGLGPALHAWTRQIIDVLGRYLREAGWDSPAEEAALLFAQIDGLHQHYVLDPKHYPIDDLTERLVLRYSTPPAARARRRP